MSWKARLAATGTVAEVYVLLLRVRSIVVSRAIGARFVSLLPALTAAFLNFSLEGTALN